MSISSNHNIWCAGIPWSGWIYFLISDNIRRFWSWYLMRRLQSALSGKLYVARLISSFYFDLKLMLRRQFLRRRCRGTLECKFICFYFYLIIFADADHDIWCAGCSPLYPGNYIIYLMRRLQSALSGKLSVARLISSFYFDLKLMLRRRFLRRRCRGTLACKFICLYLITFSVSDHDIWCAGCSPLYPGNYLSRVWSPRFILI